MDEQERMELPEWVLDKMREDIAAQFAEEVEAAKEDPDFAGMNFGWNGKHVHASLFVGRVDYAATATISLSDLADSIWDMGWPDPKEDYESKTAIVEEFEAAAKKARAVLDSITPPSEVTT